jgi:hypothetical protein
VALFGYNAKDSNVVVFSGKRSLSFTVDVALLNETGRTIGTNSITLDTGTFRFAAGDQKVSSLRALGIVRFHKVDARYLTPVLTVAITSVNGMSAQTLNATGYMRISAGDLGERAQQQEKTIAEAKGQQEAEAAEKRRQQEAEAAQRKRQQENFKTNYHVIPPLLFELGYVYEPDYPVGFRIGTFGFYTTWNFHIPDWQGYRNDGSSVGNLYYDENGNIITKISSYFVDNAVLVNREKKSFEGILGFSINVIDGWLMIPIGLGFRSSLKYGLFQYQYYYGIGGYLSDKDTTWVPAGKPKTYKEENWKTDLVFEIGLEFNPIKWISLLATYRLIGFEEHSFTVGTCITNFYRRN